MSRADGVLAQQEGGRAERESAPRLLQPLEQILLLQMPHAMIVELLEHLGKLFGVHHHVQGLVLCHEGWRDEAKHLSLEGWERAEALQQLHRVALQRRLCRKTVIKQGLLWIGNCRYTAPAYIK